jgi:hypothetical protein
MAGGIGLAGLLGASAPSFGSTRPAFDRGEAGGNAASHPSTPGLAGADLRWPPLSTGVIRRLTIGSMFLLG